MRRRDFIVMLGAAAWWPLAARAQQATLPVIGILNARTKEDNSQLLDAFFQGLAEAGYVDGKNVAIEARWADAHYDRLPTLAAELVQRGVAVIFTPGGRVPAHAAKATTSTIPIVSVVSDPVAEGLAASLAHPGGNFTGVGVMSSSLGPKRLEFVREIAPDAELAMLVNPQGPSSTTDARELDAGARASGRSIRRLEASEAAGLERAFAALADRPSALLVTADAFFQAMSRRIVELATGARTPVMYIERSFVDLGGLMSYGPSLVDAYRQCGLYVARILKGEKPGDLPVIQPTRFEFVVNLKAAKAIGLTVPPTLLIAADEVIE